MTKLLIATIFFLSFQTNSSLPTIEVSTVDIDILTNSNVECTEFEQAFHKERKRRILRGQKKIESFLYEFKNLKRRNDNSDIDARAQILVKYRDHVDTICADRFSVFADGTCYMITEKLKKLIW